MVYPEVSVGTQLAAAAVAFPVAIAVGLGIHALLRNLRRRGAIGAFFARWWAWFAALVAGLGVAVAIAGPYVFARVRYGISPSPLTAGEIFVVAGILSLAYAVLIPIVRRGSGVEPPAA
jgi:hypothetical protein